GDPPTRRARARPRPRDANKPAPRAQPGAGLIAFFGSAAIPRATAASAECAALFRPTPSFPLRRMEKRSIFRQECRLSRSVRRRLLVVRRRGERHLGLRHLLCLCRLALTPLTLA